MVPDTSVKEQLKKLIELQKIDSEVYQLNQDLKDKPAHLEELKQQFEAKKAKLNELEEKSKAIQLGRKEAELELKGKEEAIAKANTKLNELKTNKEYQAMITEIEGLKADKSITEEKILKSYDDSDAIAGDIEKEKENVAEEEKTYLAQKKAVEDAVAVAKDRIQVLEGQRKQNLEDVDPNLLNKYEKIIAHKQGLGIVPLQGNSCGGCYMNVTPQNINAIKMNEEVMQCEFCTRILYIEEDMN